MIDVPDFAKLDPGGDTAVAIGVFDGVHRGHYSLLSQLRQVADDRGLLASVVSFKNHPVTVLRPEVDVSYLMPVERRVELLGNANVDLVVPLTFTRELAELTAHQFVEALHRQLNMRHLIVGPDFALGKGRTGTIKVLRQLGEEMGFQVTEVDGMLLGGDRVSSTEVRRLLSEGAVSEANDLLGRFFRLAGEVVKGDQRGRMLGFPTANLDVGLQMALPADGIYSTIATVGSEKYASATSIGLRPTFDATGRTIETFIIDFEADIYGVEVAIDFVERIRPELAFESVDELIVQMNKDVDQAAKTTTAHMHSAQVRP